MNGTIKKISSFEDLKVDVFQAIKRAYMRKGVLPVPEKPAQKSEKDSTQHRSKPKSSLAEERQDEMNPGSAEVRQKSENAEKEEKEAEEGPEKLVELTERTHDILYEATTVFPFTLFPDTVSLDREKITIAERFFWRVAKITSVPISEIMSCQASVGPFFGSLHIVLSFFVDNEKSIKFLWREDAQELQRMLHGYIIAHKRKINTTNVSTEELKVMLKDLGQGAPD